MLFLRFVFSPDLFVYLFLWNGKASGYRRFSSFPLFVSLFLCSSCTITLIISTVKRRVLIILWRFCERYEPCKMVKKDALLVYLQRRLFLLFYRATALQRGNSFPSCAWRNILFRTRFSWFDHIFTTNLWKNIFVWFSYHTSPAISYFLTKFCTLFHSFLTVLYTFHTPVQSLFLHTLSFLHHDLKKTISKWYKLL